MNLDGVFYSILLILLTFNFLILPNISDSSG